MLLHKRKKLFKSLWRILLMLSSDIHMSADITCIPFCQSLLTNLGTSLMLSSFVEVDCHLEHRSSTLTWCHYNVYAICTPEFSSLSSYRILLKTFVKYQKVICVESHRILCWHIVLLLTFSNVMNQQSVETYKWLTMTMHKMTEYPLKWHESYQQETPKVQQVIISLKKETGSYKLQTPICSMLLRI